MARLPPNVDGRLELQSIDFVSRGSRHPPSGQIGGFSAYTHEHTIPACYRVKPAAYSKNPPSASVSLQKACRNRLQIRCHHRIAPLSHPRLLGESSRRYAHWCVQERITLLRFYRQTRPCPPRSKIPVGLEFCLDLEPP